MSPPQNGPHVPTSSLLQRLLREAPADYVARMADGPSSKRLFGMVLLLLGVCALVPVISPAAGLLLAIPAVQMFRARPTPAFPRRLAEYRITTERLASVLRRVIPTLRYLERFIRPRWPTPFEATKRVVGGVVLLLVLCSSLPFRSATYRSASRSCWWHLLIWKRMECCSHLPWQPRLPSSWLRRQCFGAWSRRPFGLPCDLAGNRQLEVAGAYGVAIGLPFSTIYAAITFANDGAGAVCTASA